MKLKDVTRQTREMTTEAQRFRFVLRFVGLDLARFRAGDWLNLQEDLRDFLLPTHADLRAGGLHTWVTEAPMPDTYPDTLFHALQTETYELLARVIASRADPQAWTPTRLCIQMTNPHVPALPDAQPGRHFWSVQGAVRDLFLLRVSRLLGTVNTALLTRCPECDTLFLRKRNQIYCTKRCVDRVGQRRWREQRAATSALAAPEGP